MSVTLALLNSNVSPDAAAYRPIIRKPVTSGAPAVIVSIRRMPDFGVATGFGGIRVMEPMVQRSILGAKFGIVLLVLQGPLQ